MLKLFKMSKLTDWAAQYRASKAAFEKGLRKEEDHIQGLQGLVKDRLQLIARQSKGNTAQVVIVLLRGFVTDLKGMTETLRNSPIRVDLDTATNNIEVFFRQKNQEWVVQPNTTIIIREAFSYVVSVLNATVFKDLKTQLSILTHFEREFERAA